MLMRKILWFFIAAAATSIAFAQHGPVPVPPTGAAHLSTVAMIDLPGRPGFEDLAFANNLIVIAQSGANAVDVFDPQKRRMVAQITNIGQPHGIAVDARNNRFYVAAANSVIEVISSQDWEVKDSFTVQGSADVLALSADGMHLYFGDKSNSTVSSVDTSLRKTIATAQLEGRPESIVVGDGNIIYVTVQDQPAIVGLDPQMKSVANFKLQGSQPTGLVYDSPSHRLYVAVRSAVLAINADNGAEVARVPAPRGVDSLSFDPASHTLFATGGGSVISMNTAGGLTSIDELLADVKGHSLVYDPTRKLLFLPGGREGRSKMLIVKDLSQAPAQDIVPAEAKLR